MSTPLPTGATSGATSYHDVCLDGQTPKAKGMTIYPGHNRRVFVIHNFQMRGDRHRGGGGGGWGTGFGLA